SGRLPRVAKTGYSRHGLQRSNDRSDEIALAARAPQQRYGRPAGQSARRTQGEGAVGALRWIARKERAQVPSNARRVGGDVGNYNVDGTGGVIPATVFDTRRRSPGDQHRRIGLPAVSGTEHGLPMRRCWSPGEI